MIAQAHPSSSSPSDAKATGRTAESAVGGAAKVVEIEDLGRRMIRDLEAFLSEALRPSAAAAWPRAGRRMIGCDRISCPRCRTSVAEVESC
jgi:hypothetical protein